MSRELVTGNHAAGRTLALAGEANRNARGAACGIYPITPQTEIVEYIAKFPFTKGRVVAVESEHSAMGVCLGASLAGARSFTASASNGLAYMMENIMVAGFYRLPIVMAAVNRTLGPPWNIWVDQGDTLCLRDFAWIQMYCETNQEVADSMMLAFRVAEDLRVLLPAMVCMDAFIMSHTLMETDLPTQEQVDQFLPELELPHQINQDRPTTVGALAWPQQTLSMRVETDEAMARVPEVYEEHRQTFQKIFGRDPGGLLDAYETKDADTILITSGTIATTTREVIKIRRANGEKIGMIKMKMLRPFPSDQLQDACKNAKKIAVLDRNYAAGIGGVWWQDIRASFQGNRDDLIIQNYLTGVTGGDVTPKVVQEVVDDIINRTEATDPVWKGIDK